MKGNTLSGWIALFGGVALAGGFEQAFADTILSSKHDLSAAGPGEVRATSESEICMFCHTPHRGTGEQPLWNHVPSSATYIPYSSSTAKATIGQPTGSSKLCLSCHDGTVALGMVASSSTPITMRNNVTTLPAGPSNLGTDLSDDHPISFRFDNALVSANGQLKDPATLKDKVRLDHNQELQCISCHDPHNNQFGKFLVQDNTESALCVTCHNMNFWQQTSHRLSNKTWNGTGINPWPHTKGTTVAANACENCHAPHNAGIKPRLLTFPDEEQNCYSCHSGNVAAKNVQAEFNKISVHPVTRTSGVHDPTEDPVNPPRHVECADCHNPHASKPASAVAPTASGALAGVAGINSSGALVNPLTAEYELCYRCHGDSVARGPARVNRQFVQTNTRLEFQSSNMSFHPIESVGKNPNVPSLISPWTASSRMYCTDCHNSDQGPTAGGAGPNGPHGSLYTPILEQQLVMSDNTTENLSSYALCYKCHDRDRLLSDQSFKAVNSSNEDRGHRFHIVDQKTACTTCHDSHGVEGTRHLMNFNPDYVTPSTNGLPIIQYTSTGVFSGTCTLSCHGFDHAGTSYPTLTAGALRGAPARRSNPAKVSRPPTR